MRYVDNPNGSLDDIAGICNDGRQRRRAHAAPRAGQRRAARLGRRRRAAASRSLAAGRRDARARTPRRRSTRRRVAITPAFLSTSARHARRSRHARVGDALALPRTCDAAFTKSASSADRSTLPRRSPSSSVCEVHPLLDAAASRCERGSASRELARRWRPGASRWIPGVRFAAPLGLVRARALRGSRVTARPSVAALGRAPLCAGRSSCDVLRGLGHVGTPVDHARPSFRRITPASLLASSDDASARSACVIEPLRYRCDRRSLVIGRDDRRPSRSTGSSA